MTQALMPWHVLTHLTAIHLHGSQALGLGLGGHEFRELGGQRNHPVNDNLKSPLATI